MSENVKIIRHDHQAEVDLRDMFAGQALNGICSTLTGGPVYYDVIAIDCYKLADAMLNERSKK